MPRQGRDSASSPLLAAPRTPFRGPSPPVPLQAAKTSNFQPSSPLAKEGPPSAGLAAAGGGGDSGRGGGRRKKTLRSGVKGKGHTKPEGLTELELLMCAEAFKKAAESPFLSGVRVSDNNSELATTQSGTQIESGGADKGMLALSSVGRALQILGLFLQGSVVRAIVARNNKKCASSSDTATNGVVLEEFINIVRDVKQYVASPAYRPRDCDVMEAFTGLGGTGDKQCGLPARNLYAFMENLGISFDERAKLLPSGDLADQAEYDENEGAEHTFLGNKVDLSVLIGNAAKPDADEEPDEPPKPLPDTPTQQYLTAFSNGDARRLFKGLCFAVMAATRLRRSRLPWFLDSVRLGALPASSGGQPHTRVEFKPADRWTGRRHGYFFTRGILGLGYYIIRTELPAFHSDKEAREESGRADAAAAADVVATVSVEDDDSGEFPDEGGNLEPDPVTGELRPVPKEVWLLRKRVRRGKELLTSTINGGWREVRQAREAASPHASPRLVASDEAAGDAATAAVTTSSAPSTPAAAAKPPTQDAPPPPPVATGTDVAARSPEVREKPDLIICGIRESQKEQHEGCDLRESGLFREDKRRLAKGPFRETFAQAVLNAAKNPAAMSLHAAAEATDMSAGRKDDGEGSPERADFASGPNPFAKAFTTRSEWVSKVWNATGDAAKGGASESPSHEGRGSAEESAGRFLGARWMWSAQQELAAARREDANSDRTRAGLQQSGFGGRGAPAVKVEQSDGEMRYRRVSVMLREVVINLLANKRADQTARAWRRQRVPSPGAVERGAPAPPPPQELSWLHWRLMEDANNLCAEDDGNESRTFSDRLRELDDQLVSDDEDEYVGDPEVGKRLAVYAREMGLRSHTEMDDQEDGDEGVERISELSDIAPEDRLIQYEEFAACFDRFRVYKSHKNVDAFQLPARVPRRTEQPLAHKMRAILVDACTAEQVPCWRPFSPRATAVQERRRFGKFPLNSHVVNRRLRVIRQKAEGAAGLPTAKDTVLITWGGGLVKPWRGMRYRNTPRREHGALMKGTSRYLTSDWVESISGIRNLDKGLRSWDTSETLAMARTLKAYDLPAHTGADLVDDDSVQSASALLNGSLHSNSVPASGRGGGSSGLQDTADLLPEMSILVAEPPKLSSPDQVDLGTSVMMERLALCCQPKEMEPKAAPATDTAKRNAILNDAVVVLQETGADPETAAVLASPLASPLAYYPMDADAWQQPSARRSPGGSNNARKRGMKELVKGVGAAMQATSMLRTMSSAGEAAEEEGPTPPLFEAPPGFEAAAGYEALLRVKRGGGGGEGETRRLQAARMLSLLVAQHQGSSSGEQMVVPPDLREMLDEIDREDAEAGERIRRDSLCEPPPVRTPMIAPRCANLSLLTPDLLASSSHSSDAGNKLVISFVEGSGVRVSRDATRSPLRKAAAPTRRRGGKPRHPPQLSPAESVLSTAATAGGADEGNTDTGGWLTTACLDAFATGPLPHARRRCDTSAKWLRGELRRAREASGAPRLEASTARCREAVERRRQKVSLPRSFLPPAQGEGEGEGGARCKPPIQGRPSRTRTVPARQHAQHSHSALPSAVSHKQNTLTTTAPVIPSVDCEPQPPVNRTPFIPHTPPRPSSVMTQRSDAAKVYHMPMFRSAQ